MVELEITRHVEHALVRASGRLVTADAAAALADSVAFVPEDDDVIVDLRGLSEIARPCVRRLRVELARRVSWSDVVVVVDDPDVTVELVLCDVDRIAPLVRTLDDAARVLRARGATLDAPA